MIKEIKNVHFSVHSLAFTVLIRLYQVFLEKVVMVLILALYILLYTWRTWSPFLFRFAVSFIFFGFSPLCFPLILLEPAFLILSVFPCSLYFTLFLQARVWWRFFVKFIRAIGGAEKLLPYFFLLSFLIVHVTTSISGEGTKL